MLTRPWARRCSGSSVGRADFVAEFGLWDETQCAHAERIAAELDQVDLVRVAFCDPHGLARSKTVTTDAFRRVLRNGMDFSPGPFLFDTGHAVAVDFLADDPDVAVSEIVGAGDFVLVPDPKTFQLLPDREPRTAWVLGDEYLRDGSPHPLSARAVLRRVCEQYAAADLEPIVGLEVEWYLTRALGGVPGHAGNGFGRQGAAPAVEALNAGYQFNLDGYYDTIAPITDPLALALRAMGLPLRSMEHESGPGQVETTFDPLSAADAADAMVLFRTLTKQHCARRGHHASFMALPAIDGFDPSGWHLHQSVANSKTGHNVLAGDVENPLSVDGDAYVGGLIALARDLCLLAVPTVNGYRRLRPEFGLSPSRADRSVENRTAMIRICGADGSTHIENRIGEPNANPYLAIAAQLWAGLSGLLDSGRFGVGCAAPPELPQSLEASLRAFRASPHPLRLLGDPLATVLAKLKQSEQTRFQEWCAATGDEATRVTDWEQREYFGVF